LKIITIVSIIKRQPDWVSKAVKEYCKRLSGELDLKFVDIPPITRSKNTASNKILLKEASSILKMIPDNNYTIALDEKGKKITTQNLAESMDQWTGMNQQVCFIIGGADGLCPTVKKEANETWSLSSLTFPHTMVRVILAEQLYRASSILKNHPYHRD